MRVLFQVSQPEDRLLARRRQEPNVVNLRDKLLKINEVMRFVFYGIVNATEVVFVTEIR
jgi:hypothetical protein